VEPPLRHRAHGRARPEAHRPRRRRLEGPAGGACGDGAQLSRRPGARARGYRTIGLAYSSVIIDPGAQEILKANTATHNAAEVLLKRPIIKNEVQQALAAYLNKYGIELKEAALANIRFDAAYEKAVEAKQIEEQKAEQKRYELIQAQRQAEIVAATAKGKGDAALAEARGVADALRIKGEAEAAYNARVAASLTPVLIQQQYLARWDGRLPQYTFSGNAVPFVQLPGASGR
jgi:regulator of protease activity HflC (stomatin/prohibitin superfamily)